MFIPLNHVTFPATSITPLGALYSADNKTNHVLGQTTFRILQTLTIDTVNKTVQPAKQSGLTKGYLPVNSHLTPGSCLRNNCTSCRYPFASPFPNAPYIALGQCVTGSSQCNLLASDMNTVRASVVAQTQTSMTVEFAGDPDNACQGSLFGISLAADISWLHRITISWGSGNPQYSLVLSHDGFPSHQIFVGNSRVYSFDPVNAGKSPWSLAFPRDVSTTVSGSL